MKYFVGILFINLNIYLLRYLLSYLFIYLFNYFVLFIFLMNLDDLSGNFENMTVESGGNGTTGSFEMINTIDQPTESFSTPGSNYILFYFINSLFC